MFVVPKASHNKNKSALNQYSNDLYQKATTLLYWYKDIHTLFQDSCNI